MSFFVDGNPTQSEISDAINYLLANIVPSSSTNQANGQIVSSTGAIIGYLYKYLAVKYSDSFDGSVNFSNTPTNRQYYGLRNTNDPSESTNPSDYIWVKVTGGFGTTKQIFYSVTGGRRIDILATIAAPSALYQADSGSSIDLDVISGADGASSRICYAKSTSFSLSSIPATYQTAGKSSFPPYNTWGGNETWQASPPAIYTNEALFQSDGIYNPMTDLTTWNAPYLSTLKVGQLSAISADLGTVTAGELVITKPSSSTPQISGTTMTGAGSHLYSDGRFAMGNSSQNIVFNGSNIYLNGVSTQAQSGVSFSVWRQGVSYDSSIYIMSVSQPTRVLISFSGVMQMASTDLNVAAWLGQIRFILRETTTSTDYELANTQIGSAAYLIGTTKSARPSLSMSYPLVIPSGNYNLVITNYAQTFYNSAGTSFTPTNSGVIYPYVDVIGTWSVYTIIA